MKTRVFHRIGGLVLAIGFSAASWAALWAWSPWILAVVLVGLITLGFVGWLLPGQGAGLVEPHHGIFLTVGAVVAIAVAMLWLFVARGHQPLI